MTANLRGSLLMVAAMLGFAFEDMFIKAASHGLPPGEVLLVFGAAGTLVFGGMTLRAGETLVPPAFFRRPLLLRAASEILGRVFYTLAIAFTPLSNASAILQAAPLVVVLGAIVFFGERVGWRRWMAIFVGFGGVLLILRPGVEGFQASAVLAVLGMLGFAGRDLATRASPAVLSNRQLGLSGFVMILIAGMILLVHSGGAAIPAPRALAEVLGASVFGTAGYHALTGAMRTGDISVVTPFRYSRLLFGLAFGVTVFGERPDAATLAGGAVIVAAGIYTLLRSRRG